MPDLETQTTIRRLVAAVERDENQIGVFSTGERLAVALVLNRKDWLDEWKYSMLEAVNRLGADWFKAAVEVQRERW